jgi:hypothetical protein
MRERRWKTCPVLDHRGLAVTNVELRRVEGLTDKCEGGVTQAIRLEAVPGESRRPYAKRKQAAGFER